MKIFSFFLLYKVYLFRLFNKIKSKIINKVENYEQRKN